MAKISIIIPVYNVENYLERCVYSVLTQNLKDIEVILVNDGSTDSSGVLCDDFAIKDNRIKVVHKQNGGLSSARNEGLKYATSDLVGFIDSDDWISSDMYEYLWNLQEKNDADIVSCNYMLAYDYPTKINNAKIKEYVFTRNEALKKYLELGAFSRINDYSACKKIYKKELFSDVEFPDGMLFEDMPTNFRLIQKCSKYVFSTKVCYFYFQNSVSITRNQYSKRHNDLIKSSEMIGLYAKKEDNDIQKLAKILRIKSYFSLLTKVVRFGVNDDVDDVYISENLLIPFRDDYKAFMNSKFSWKIKILGTLYNFAWKFTKKIFQLIRFIKGNI